MFINDKPVAEGRIPKTVPYRWGLDETIDVEQDSGTPVVKGNLAYATGLMLLMMALTALYMPFALSIALQQVQVNPWQIAKPLLTLMLIPVVIGLLRLSSGRI